MMEIQIIQDSEEDCSDNEGIASDNTNGSAFQDANTSPRNSQELKATENVSLVDSYILSPESSSHIVDSYVNQDDDIGDGMTHVFPAISQSSDKQNILQIAEKSNEESEHFPKEVLRRFVIGGKEVHHSVMQTMNSDSAVDTLIDDTEKCGDVSFNLQKEIDGNEQRYVIFSSGSHNTPTIVTMAKGNSQQLAIAVDNSNNASERCFSDVSGTSTMVTTPVTIDRQPKTGESVGLNMIFEVVGEITNPDGQVFMREITTQTQPPRKQRPMKRKRKGSDDYVVNITQEVEENDSSIPVNEKRFSCGTCNLKFASEETRDIHQRCHKGSMRDYYCYFCNFTSPQWTKMHHHLFKHGVEKPHKCNQCSFSCKNKSDLTSHMAVHSNLKRFQCPKCKRQYKHRRNVVAHQRSCSGVDESGRPQKIEGTEKFECKICKKQLSTKKNLDKHSEIHLDLKPFVCSKCGHATRLKESLIMHERLHTGEKPFKCDICDYATPDKSSLRRHKRTHTKEKPYKCKHCSYCCIQKHCLDTHIRRKHTGEQFVCGLCHYATHDRYALNQHFKRHQNPDGTISQHEIEVVNQDKQTDKNLSFLNAEQSSRTTYIGLPSGTVLKSSSETSKEDEDSQTKGFTNPVILRIAPASELDTEFQIRSHESNADKDESTAFGNTNSAQSSEDKIPSEVSSVELDQFETDLIHNFRQPGDEVFVQTTGEIVIRRPDGNLLVIQRREGYISDVNFEQTEETNEQEYLTSVSLAEISQPQTNVTNEDTMADLATTCDSASDRAIS